MFYLKVGGCVFTKWSIPQQKKAKNTEKIKI